MSVLNILLLFLLALFIKSVKADQNTREAEDEKSNFQPESSASDVSERFAPGMICARNGDWCMLNSHCCSMNCGWDFHCKNYYDSSDICIPDFGRCIESQQCCSGQCYGGYICAATNPYYKGLSNKASAGVAPPLGAVGLGGARPVVG